MGNEGDASYVIRTGAAAVPRLELLARLFWPSTEDLLTRTGAFDARRFLDVGCGIGDVASRVAMQGVSEAVGIDLSPDVVEAASARARRHDAPAVFRAVGLEALAQELDLKDADVVFARCLITHLPNPADALALLLAAVRPGGSLLIEDVEVEAVWCSPPCEALARHRDLYVSAARGLGAHPDFAPRIPEVLRQLGAEVHVDVVQPVLREPADLQIQARTMEAIAEPVLAQRLATESEVSDLVQRLDEWAATPGVVATLPRIVQVSARKP